MLLITFNLLCTKIYSPLISFSCCCFPRSTLAESYTKVAQKCQKSWRSLMQPYQYSRYIGRTTEWRPWSTGRLLVQLWGRVHLPGSSGQASMQLNKFANGKNAQIWKLQANMAHLRCRWPWKTKTTLSNANMNLHYKHGHWQWSHWNSGWLLTKWTWVFDNLSSFSCKHGMQGQSTWPPAAWSSFICKTVSGGGHSWKGL